MIYYILGGEDGRTPVAVKDALTWAQWFTSAERYVAVTQIASVEISTLFLGLDHNVRGTGPPELFETMTFTDYGGGQMWRYSTWDEAEAGHRRVCEEIRAWLATAPMPNLR